MESSSVAVKAPANLTSNLGDDERIRYFMMSISIRREELDINPEVFEHWNTHIHVPEEPSQKMGHLHRNHYDHISRQVT